jgi:hypothetical protein
MAENKWSAKIANSEIVPPGTLRVNVQFINSADTSKNFNHVFETSQKQDESWIQNQIRERLFHLNELPNLHALVQKKQGEEILHDVRPGDPLAGLSPEAAEWKRNYDYFHKYATLSMEQIVESEHAKFVELRKWLKENFRDEYIDLV